MPRPSTPSRTFSDEVSTLPSGLRFCSSGLLGGSRKFARRGNVVRPTIVLGHHEPFGLVLFASTPPASRRIIGPIEPPSQSDRADFPLSPRPEPTRVSCRAMGAAKVGVCHGYGADQVPRDGAIHCNRRRNGSGFLPAPRRHPTSREMSALRQTPFLDQARCHVGRPEPLVGRSGRRDVLHQSDQERGRSCCREVCRGSGIPSANGAEMARPGGGLSADRGSESTGSIRGRLALGTGPEGHALVGKRMARAHRTRKRERNPAGPPAGFESCEGERHAMPRRSIRRSGHHVPAHRRMR
jgi:hypothetical protein